MYAEVVRREARNHLEDLPGFANLVIGDLLSEVAHLDERVKQYDVHIRTDDEDGLAPCAVARLTSSRSNSISQAVMAVSGSATASA